MERVVRLADPAIRSGGRRIDLSRALHGERLMGPLLIELLDKGIELGLLLQEVGAGRPCCFFLQGQVHTLMSSVLLGMTGPKPVDADAQAQPPDEQLRQIKKSIRRSERNAIVG